MPSPSSASSVTSKGEWAGQTFTFAPWQAFVVGSLFGWQRTDGLRASAPLIAPCPARRRRPSRPASCSTSWSPTANRAPRSTPPPPPAIRPASCSRKPSGWSDSRLAQALGPGADQQPARTLRPPRASCRSRPIQLHGRAERARRHHRSAARPKTRHVVDLLGTATGARRQPLLFEITTAGYDRHSISSSTTTTRSSCSKAPCRTTAGSPTSPPPTRATTGPSQVGAGQTELRGLGERGRSCTQAERRSPCRAPRTLPPNAPQRMGRAGRALDRLAAWDACDGPVDLEHSAAGPASAASISRRRTTSPPCLGVPARPRRWPLARAVALLRAGGEPPQACRAGSRALRLVGPAGLHPGDARQRRRLWRHRAAHSAEAALFQVRETAYDP